MEDEARTKEQLLAELHELRKRVAQLEKKPVKHKRAEEALDRISDIFLTVSDDGMYAQVLDVVREATESEFGIFGFIADNGDLVTPSMTREIWSECQVPDKSIIFPQSALVHTLWGKAIREQKAFHSDGPFQIPEGHIHIHSFVTAPVVFAGKTIGVLSVANREGGYTDEDKDLLESIAGFVSPILNARLQRDRKEQDRRQAVRELQKSNDLLRAIIEAAPTAIIGLDLDGNVQSVWNPAAERMLGWSAQEVMGRPLPSVPAAKQEEFSALRERMRSDLSLDGVEVRRQRRGGTPIDYSIYASPLHDADGRVTGNIAVLVDITDRKRAEEDRLAHLKFLESMDHINRATQGTDDLDQMMSDVLDAVLSVFNCDRAFLSYPCDPDAGSWTAPMERNRPEYPGVLELGLIVPMDMEVAETFRRILDSDGPVQFGPGTGNPLPKDVSERFGFKCLMSMALYPRVGKPWQFGIHQCSYARAWTPEEERLFQEIGRRLTDRLTSLLSFRELQESERKLEEAQRIAHLGYWDRDLETGRVVLSEETCKIFGLPPQECSLDLARWDTMWNELIHPDDRARTTQAVVDALQGCARYDVEYRLIRPSGEVRFVSSRGDVTWDRSGKPRRIFGMMQDVTERKQVERIMQARLRLLEFAVSHSMDELLTATLDEIEALTGSSIGFYHFLESDQKTLSLQSWSTNTLERMCAAEGKGSLYDVAEAGVWADCLHERRPVIHNDYASLPHRKGMPEGHVPVSREVICPIFRGDKIVAILGVGNKCTDYGEPDIEIVSQLGDLSWDIVERKRAEQEIRKSRDELELRVKERTEELEAANQELRRVPSRLIAVQEEERKRLAQELHDSIGQTLAALKYHIELALVTKNHGDAEGAFKHIEQFIPTLQRSINETRAIYTGLRPKSLEEMGLVATLQWFCREFMELYPKHHLEIQLGVKEEEIPEDLKITIFRISQEALNNISKHSKAEWVDLSLQRNGDVMELTISDDGVGMDLDFIRSHAATARSLGLTSMRERAELTGGNFSIESTPGEGTTVHARWALDLSQEH